MASLFQQSVAPCMVRNTPLTSDELDFCEKNDIKVNGVTVPTVRCAMMRERATQNGNAGGRSNTGGTITINQVKKARKLIEAIFEAELATSPLNSVNGDWTPSDTQVVTSLIKKSTTQPKPMRPPTPAGIVFDLDNIQSSLNKLPSDYQNRILEFASRPTFKDSKCVPLSGLKRGFIARSLPALQELWGNPAYQAKVGQAAARREERLQREGGGATAINKTAKRHKGPVVGASNAAEAESQLRVLAQLKEQLAAKAVEQPR